MRVKLEDVCYSEYSNLKQSDVIEFKGVYPVYGATGFLSSADFYHQDKKYVAIVKDGAGIGKTKLLPEKSSVIGTMQYLIPKDNILPEYLYYVTNQMHLEKHHTGSTIPHIYFKDYRKDEFNLPDIESQKKIVSILKNNEKIIEGLEQEHELLDKLVKARFVEMFSNNNYPILKWREVFNTTTGRLDSNASVENGKYPFFTCSKDILKIDSYAFDQKALLLAGNNAAGKYDVKYYSGKFNAYQRTYVLGLKDNWSYQLFKYQLEDKLIYLQQQSLGGLTKYLTMKILEQLDFIVPPIEKQLEFDDFVKQVDKSKLAVQKSLEKTQQLFDSLMQEYFG